ncbi:hypothetical protein TNIN_499661 [Trichonephila inaurata madagascariensis]|uniref:Uncharacterized protein n=1 Tax=Trichonephila inaurata madagascariensis TaxID=2747483 RepID=A0A8X6JAM6_9ARAC|nr:hypothetical protein TNIN_499661 [Trichonephila inaurata madagascariensis]
MQVTLASKGWEKFAFQYGLLSIRILRSVYKPQLTYSAISRAPLFHLADRDLSVDIIQYSSLRLLRSVSPYLPYTLGVPSYQENNSFSILGPIWRTFKRFLM